jgi:hypothetical protein
MVYNVAFGSMASQGASAEEMSQPPSTSMLSGFPTDHGTGDFFKAGQHQTLLEVNSRQSSGATSLGADSCAPVAGNNTFERPNDAADAIQGEEIS